MRCMHAEGRQHEDTRRRQPRERPTEKPNLLTPWAWTPELGENTFLLSPSFCSVLLWQPEQSNATSLHKTFSKAIPLTPNLTFFLLFHLTIPPMAIWLLLQFQETVATKVTGNFHITNPANTMSSMDRHCAGVEGVAVVIIWVRDASSVCQIRE